MDFTGKTVLITGASSGIGREAASEFAGKGASVILVARRREMLEQVRAKLGGDAVSYPCDISSSEQVQEMAKTILDKYGPPDILVNNAGFAIYGPVADLTTEEISSQMDTNYMGMVRCTKSFLPGMLGRGSGHIVNVASLAASFGVPGIAAYCASKHAMLGFSEALKYELAGTGVGITIVSPIMVRTPFFDHRSFDKMPKNTRLSLDPGTVARAILRAANSPRLEITVPAIARAAVWLKHAIPYAINPALARSFRPR